MKTSLEMDTSTNLINPKPSQLQVLLIKEEGDPIIIGEADFDLSVYSQPNQLTERVFMIGKENTE